MTFRPTPVQRPRIPVWVVGAWPSERSMRRAARWDGVVRPGDGSGRQPGRARGAGRDRRAGSPAPARARAAGGPFDIVVDGAHAGRRPGGGRERPPAPRGGRGATWWIEADWSAERGRRCGAGSRPGPPRAAAPGAAAVRGWRCPRGVGRPPMGRRDRPRWSGLVVRVRRARGRPRPRPRRTAPGTPTRRRSDLGDEEEREGIVQAVIDSRRSATRQAVNAWWSGESGVMGGPPSSCGRAEHAPAPRRTPSWKHCRSQCSGTDRPIPHRTRSAVRSGHRPLSARTRGLRLGLAAAFSRRSPAGPAAAPVREADAGSPRAAPMRTR